MKSKTEINYKCEFRGEWIGWMKSLPLFRRPFKQLYSKQISDQLNRFCNSLFYLCVRYMQPFDIVSITNKIIFHNCKKFPYNMEVVIPLYDTLLRVIQKYDRNIIKFQYKPTKH